jgi:hypothetical protein
MNHGSDLGDCCFADRPASLVEALSFSKDPREDASEASSSSGGSLRLPAVAAMGEFLGFFVFEIK